MTDQLADGPWNATIVLRSGLVTGTYEAQITFPHQPGTAPSVSAHEQQSPGLDPLLLAILLAILAGTVALIIYFARRRRRDRRASGHDIRQPERSTTKFKDAAMKRDGPPRRETRL
jgi:hypothetical protein